MKLTIAKILGVIAFASLVVLLVGAGQASAQTRPNQGYGGGYIQGWVYGCCTYDDQLIVIYWPTVTASNNEYTFVSHGGATASYDMYLPVGTYNLTADAPGFKPYTMSIAVSDGSSSTLNFYLERTYVPIPEFPAQTTALIMIIGLSATLVARRAGKRRTAP